MRPSLFCPGCSLARLRPAVRRSLTVWLKNRPYSTTASATAVNATHNIPSRNRKLHDALTELKKTAPEVVNISRLKLAIHGLEREDPVIRIALLGLGTSGTALRLARILLADSSRPAQKWETQILKGPSPQQSLLIKYGTTRDEDSLPPQRDALPVLYVPSALLQSQNIEILVSDVPLPENQNHPAEMTPSDVLLSPRVRSGHSTVTQPVHRALLVGQGSEQLLSVAELVARTSFESCTERDSVSATLDFPAAIGTSGPRFTMVDLIEAENGLEAARKLEKSSTLESWAASNISAVVQQLSTSSPKALSLPPALTQLITSILDSASQTISTQPPSPTPLPSLSSPALTPSALSTLSSAIALFSTQSHAELQAGLATAWSSRNWRKLAFWKLPFRVDDIALILTNLVTTAWLPLSERAIYELSGRLKQAGLHVRALPSAPTVSPPLSQSTSALKSSFSLPLLPSPPPSSLVIPTSPTTNTKTATSASLAALAIPFLRAPEPFSLPSTPQYTPPPLAQSLSSARTAQLTASVTSVTSAAQSIVARALSQTGSAAATGVLTYLLFPAAGWSGGLAVAGVGWVWMLRTMQREWGRVCGGLENQLRERGSEVLKDVVGRLEEAVQEGWREVREREAMVGKGARDPRVLAVAKAREALKNLVHDKGAERPEKGGGVQKSS